jgi:phosphate-selective porin OprO/OprP
MRLVVAIGLMSGLMACLPRPCSGQDRGAASREEQLEDLVRELRNEVDQLKQRVNQLEGGEVDRSTAERIENLEQTIEVIQKETPTPEEMSKLKKWASDSLTMRPFWKDGLRFESNDGSVKLKIGGRIQADAAFFAEDGDLERRFGDFEDGVEFRRARIYIEGEIRGGIDFKAQYDFAEGDPEFKDVYIGFSDVPGVGNIQIGQFKEPFSLEELTSSNYITFMERSLANVFSPARNVGVMFHDSFLSDRVTGAFGVFRPTDDFGRGVGDHDYHLTARVTALPLYEDDGEKLIHLGIAYSYQEYEDPLAYSQRPEAHLAPRLIATGEFGADHGDILGAEAAFVCGPLSVQAEIMNAAINGEGAFVGDPDFWGGYVQASYFLTGEHRPYKLSSGTFDRVKPLNNFREDGGWGAWEVAGRYSHLDLSDGSIRGGRLREATLGLNWYMNPSVRVMWNYGYVNASSGGDANIFQTRVQIAF